MRSEDAALLLLALGAAALAGIYSQTQNIHPLIGIAIAMGVYSLVFVHRLIYRLVESTVYSLSEAAILRMGRGIPPWMVRTPVLALTAGTIALLFISVYTLTKGPSLAVYILTLVTTSGMIIALLLPRIRVTFAVGERKTAAEVELPFLLMMLMTLSETHATVYDIMRFVAGSESLRAWRREIRLAERLAAASNTSLLNALRLVSRLHPSQTVRDIFGRIVTVASTIGVAGAVIERAFITIYRKLEIRIQRLAENADILAGVMIMIFIMVPLGVLSAGPLLGITRNAVILITIAVELPSILLLAVIISHTYPSGFVPRSNRLLLVAGILGVGALVGLGYFYVSPFILSARAMEPGMPDLIFYAASLGAIVPATVFGEYAYRKLKLYNQFIEVVTDAAETSVTTGEPVASVIDRMALARGTAVHRLARSVIEGYLSPQLRRLIVLRAPTIFHAAFIETLLYVLLLGAPSRAVKKLADAYERLHVWLRMEASARTIEVMLYSLTAVTAVFIDMIRGIYQIIGTIGEIMRRVPVGVGAVRAMFNYDPGIYYIMSAVTFVVLVIVGVLIGKLRTGSFLYGFRTGFIAGLAYAVTALIAPHITGRLMPELPELPEIMP